MNTIDQAQSERKIHTCQTTRECVLSVHVSPTLIMQEAVFTLSVPHGPRSVKQTEEADDITLMRKYDIIHLADRFSQLHLL